MLDEVPAPTVPNTGQTGSNSLGCRTGFSSRVLYMTC